MITRQEILDRTIEVIYESVPELEGTELREDTVINTDTAIDSMGFTLVICRLEARFNVRIPDRQWQRLSTLGDVVDAIEKRLPQD
jgi:acyl carrier protein